MSSEDAQGWVPATCLEAQDDPDDFSLPGEEGTVHTVMLYIQVLFFRFHNPMRKI